MVHVLRKGGKRTTFRSSMISSQSEEVRQKYHLLCGLIRKVRRNNTRTVQDKPQKDKEKEKEKENENGMGHCGSHSRLLKREESKGMLPRQFSSTINIHSSIQRPLSEYCSNRKNEEPGSK